MKATNLAHPDLGDGSCRLYRSNDDVDTFASDLVQEERRSLNNKSVSLRYVSAQNKQRTPLLSRLWRQNGKVIPSVKEDDHSFRAEQPPEPDLITTHQISLLAAVLGLLARGQR
jgi:hypothetical protein